MHADRVLKGFQIEEDAIVAYTQAELGWLVSQRPYVTLEWLDRKPVECANDPVTITQWQLSQTFLRGPREDQRPSHA